MIRLSTQCTVGAIKLFGQYDAHQGMGENEGRQRPLFGGGLQARIRQALGAPDQKCERPARGQPEPQILGQGLACPQTPARIHGHQEGVMGDRFQEPLSLLALTALGIAPGRPPGRGDLGQFEPVRAD